MASVNGRRGVGLAKAALARGRKANLSDDERINLLQNQVNALSNDITSLENRIDTLEALLSDYITHNHDYLDNDGTSDTTRTTQGVN